MPFHTVNLVVTTDAGRVPAILPQTYTFSNDIVLDETLTAPLTNHPIVLLVDASLIRSWFIVASVGMTLKTNVTTTSPPPDNTWVLLPGKAVFWNTDVNDANPISVDITMLYVSFSGSGTGTLTGHFLCDAG